MRTLREMYAAWHLDLDQTVGCALCVEQGDHTSYRHGEAFLQSGLLSPFGDGNAHYMCKRHLDPDAVILTAASVAPSEERGQ